MNGCWNCLGISWWRQRWVSSYKLKGWISWIIWLTCRVPSGDIVDEKYCCTCWNGSWTNKYFSPPHLVPLTIILAFSPRFSVHSTSSLQVYETPFFVAVDHAKKKVVISIRGTLSPKVNIIFPCRFLIVIRLQTPLNISIEYLATPTPPRASEITAFMQCSQTPTPFTHGEMWLSTCGTKCPMVYFSFA